MHGNIVEGAAALIRIQGVEGVLTVGERGVQGCIKMLRSQQGKGKERSDVEVQYGTCILLCSLPSKARSTQKAIK